MLSKEKIIVFFNKQISNFWFHLVFWCIALSFYIFLIGENNIFSTYTKQIESNIPYILIILVSPFVSLFFTIIDFIFSDKFMRIFPFRITLILKSIFYFISIFVLFIMVSFPTLNINQITDFNYLTSLMPKINITLYRFLTFYYIACFFNVFFKSFLKKMSGVNIKKWIFGVLNKPHEEERIFMFLDLKDSTTFAEKMGHKKFSHLIQDVFNDMSVIYNYKAEIYNYVGDGAVVSWDINKGLRYANCLQAYFAFTGVLTKRKKYYKRKYGVEPKFKAGAHIGKVMALQIGQIRRDISYNGDTINTAARIESKCNELRQNFLISSSLKQELEKYKYFNFRNMGEMQLKGKRKNVELFAVKQKQK